MRWAGSLSASLCHGLKCYYKRNFKPGLEVSWLGINPAEAKISEMVTVSVIVNKYGSSDDKDMLVKKLATYEFGCRNILYLIFESLSIYCLNQKRKAKHPIEKIKAEKEKAKKRKNCGSLSSFASLRKSWYLYWAGNAFPMCRPVSSIKFGAGSSWNFHLCLLLLSSLLAGSLSTLSLKLSSCLSSWPV